jgi:hypothetical protein
MKDPIAVIDLHAVAGILTDNHGIPAYVDMSVQPMHLYAGKPWNDPDDGEEKHLAMAGPGTWGGPGEHVTATVTELYVTRDDDSSLYLPPALAYGATSDRSVADMIAAIVNGDLAFPTVYRCDTTGLWIANVLGHNHRPCNMVRCNGLRNTMEVAVRSRQEAERVASGWECERLARRTTIRPDLAGHRLIEPTSGPCTLCVLDAGRVGAGLFRLGTERRPDEPDARFCIEHGYVTGVPS